MKIRNILVPLDGSKLAEEALEPALRLASRLGADVRLVSVVSNVAPPVALAPEATEAVAHWLDREEEGAERYLETVRARVTGRWSGIDLTTCVEVGRVASTIREVASDAAADLIVLTTHGHGTWDRFWLGSIADQLARSSTVPLLFLRGGTDATEFFASPASPSHVFVPLDGSEEGGSILPVVDGLLPEGNGRITVMSVARRSVLPFSSYLSEAMVDAALGVEEAQQLRAYLDRTRAEIEAKGRGRRVDAQFAEAVDVPRTLLAAIEESGADLLALSTQGRGAMGRLLVGSVADKLIRGTRLPVLVTRKAGANE